MALSLGFKSGTVFYIDGKPMKVVSFERGVSATVEVESGERLRIVGAQMTEVYPEVMVSLGADRNAQAGPRFAFEAPRHIIIHHHDS